MGLLTIALAVSGCAVVYAICKILADIAIEEIALDDVPEGTREYIEAETRRQSLELQLEVAEELQLDAVTLNHLRDQLKEAEVACQALADKQTDRKHTANSAQ